MTKDDRLLIGLTLGLTMLWVIAGSLVAYGLATAPENPCICADGKVMFPSGGTGKIK